MFLSLVAVLMVYASCPAILRADEAATNNSAGAGSEGIVQLFQNCSIPPQTLARLQSVMSKLDASGFDYPWDNLDKAIQHMPGKKLPLIGYGSLLNRDSAARTITNTPAAGYPPVIAVGAVRVFNYVIPEDRLKVYPGTHQPREIAALNLIYTRSPVEPFNGRLLMLSAADVPALREREFGYDLRPVAAIRWGDWDEQPFVGYVLVAVKRVVKGRQVLDDGILPNPQYARVCYSGAKAVSPDFLRFYLETTYLGDRKTTLATWQQSHPYLAMDPKGSGR
jgi:hypothetical protein